MTKRRNYSATEKVNLLHGHFIDRVPVSEICERNKSIRSENPRTQMVKIIKRAGCKPCPKIFQNCRSIRETELQTIENDK